VATDTERNPTMTLLCKTFPWMIVSILAAPLPSKQVATSRPKFEFLLQRNADYWKKCYYSPQVSRTTTCKLHNVCNCPVCHENAYMRRRITNVVLGAMKRLQVPRNMPLLNYLGAETWQEVIDHLDNKRKLWNALHPGIPMTLTNTALDHIRPVNEFKDNCLLEKLTLCNHFTNLQPLLHEDNAWKGDFWSQQDEAYWRDNIILKQDNMKIYYPASAPYQPSILEAEAAAHGKTSSDSISCQCT